MKKNSYVIYGLMLHASGKRIITETYQKDWCKLFARIRWVKHHKHQRYLLCLRGAK